MVESPDAAPKWLSKGITNLLSKTKDTKNFWNCRPITSLTTTYKLLTFILTERTYTLWKNNEEKGCKRGYYGCKYQLLINKLS